MALEKTLAIFGYPLGHTMSPTMHNTAAAVLGVPYHFLAYEVAPERFEAAVRGAQAMGFAGLCITIPHKVTIGRMVDELSEDARLMGAVNVVTFEPGGRMKGHNTDGIGWLRSLEEEMGTTPKGMRCLLLGAGGAARAIAVKLAQSGAAHLEIRNRTAEKAAALAESVRKAFPGLPVAGGGLGGLEDAARDAQLIVNTTSQGMTGDAARMAALPVPEAAIPPGAICSDAVYNPAETAFLKAARRRGARGLSGVGWLVHQGAAAWEMWTGTKMPVPRVREAVLKALGAG
ncbi:MAG: shikimate dehydrogenase [Candidatus Tectomicrobia bacterium]|uniref:Shikimate dehydrogenase (NADP(+)) n=1 Tax=Tectimicrobiota bacterium TaxID=2528274 RepID=A0A932I3P1_UNCTE|nr:shikimate dehydrogenase [Candidatus Tectomicrobia bacterium]